MGKGSKTTGPYRKVYPRFWRDEKVQQLCVEEKAIALYCLTGPQTNRIGIYCFSQALAAEDCNVTKTFGKRFANVCETLGWGWDLTVKVLYIPSWWKWNPPENPNVLIGNLEDFAGVPQTALLKEFASNTEHLPGYQHETFTQTLAKRMVDTRRNQKQYQYQEQEQNQEQEQDISSEASSEPPAMTFETVGVGTKTWNLLPSKVAEYQEAFPSLDVMAECRKALQWTRDNPDKKKTPKGMPRFLGQWLDRAQNGRGGFSNGKPSGPSQHSPGKKYDPTATGDF